MNSTHDTIAEKCRTDSPQNEELKKSLVLFVGVQILVIINFIKLILLKIRVRNVKFQIYE
jgi:hypothetical protein